MTTYREWTHADVDKAAWGPGPWLDEPDKVQFVDEATGLDCLLHRNPTGAWCGYVGVAEGHPFFGRGYSECALPEPCASAGDWCEHTAYARTEVHGGLTYSGFCQDTDDESKGICHVPEPGRPHRVWWLGFDCAHAWDLIPGYQFRPGPDVYRDRTYVENEVRGLARQLAEAKSR